VSCHVIAIEATPGRNQGERAPACLPTLDEPHIEGQLRVRALDPELVWLAHEHAPWRPRTYGNSNTGPPSPGWTWSD
jgi:hypothetical protein